MDYKVLIIDQDLDDRAIIQEAVSKLGFEVHLGITSFDAINALKNDEYDLLICNNLMPTLNEGIDLVKHVRKTYKDLYMIISSNIKELRIVKEFLDIGANDYVIKPVDIDIFISKIVYKFDDLPKKDFASIGISEDKKDNICVIELNSQILSINEEEIQIKLETEVLDISTRIFIAGDFFEEMGINKDSVELEVQSLDEGILKCTYINLSELELALVRRWTLENYLLS